MKKYVVILEDEHSNYANLGELVYDQSRYVVIAKGSYVNIRMLCQKLNNEAK